MQVLNFGSSYAPGQTPYEIFSNRMAAITSIVTGIKGIIANKYINNQLKMIADNILNEVNEQKSIELTNLINEEPPEGIYPAKLEDTISQFYDFVTHPKKPMAQQQATTGLPAPTSGLPSMGVPQGIPQATTGLPAVGGGAPTTEAMIPKTDISQLYNAIKSMPSGQVNWANLLKTMTEKKPYFMGSTGPEEFVMNQMLGQTTDPRAKLEGDINLAKLVQETFYPEAKAGETFDPAQFLKDNPNMMITGYNSNTGGYSFGKKEEPESKLDMEDLNEQIAKYGLNVTGMNVNPTTGNVSYTLGKEGMSFEEKVNKGIDFVRENPGYEISSLNPGTENVSITKIKPEGAETATKTTTAEANFAEKQFEGIRTNTEYNQALAKVRQVDPSVIVPSKPELFQKNYNEAVSQIQMLINDKGMILDAESKSGYSYEMLYGQSYKDLEEAINEYRIATGETLINPFVSLEEYNKVDIKPGKGLLYPSTWGKQKSVFAGETLYKDGDIEVIKGKTYKYNAREDKWEVVSS